MIDHALPLSDQLKVVRERLGISHQRVVGARGLHVLQAVLALDLLPCLHGHSEVGYQCVVLGDLNLRLPDHEPLASIPLLHAALLLGEVEATLHAYDGLLVLPHGELLQVVVRLEEDIAHAGALQPLRLEVLQLHAAARLRPRTGLHQRVQREGGLAALGVAHLEGQGEVLEVHGAGGVHGGQHADRGTLHALLQHQAAQAPRRAGQ
mmetsp:Transcript_107929/g.337928  ORF Transcript_107929/g.337928 Transcript_107929/m.337928 type:complete len:207 (+) Transcript_107929:1427-2047(+)